MEKPGKKLLLNAVVMERIGCDNTFSLELFYWKKRFLDPKLQNDDRPNRELPPYPSGPTRVHIGNSKHIDFYFAYRAIRGPYYKVKFYYNNKFHQNFTLSALKNIKNRNCG